MRFALTVLSFSFLCTSSVRAIELPPHVDCPHEFVAGEETSVLPVIKLNGTVHRFQIRGQNREIDIVFEFNQQGKLSAKLWIGWVDVGMHGGANADAHIASRSDEPQLRDAVFEVITLKKDYVILHGKTPALKYLERPINSFTLSLRLAQRVDSLTPETSLRVAHADLSMAWPNFPVLSSNVYSLKGSDLISLPPFEGDLTSYQQAATAEAAGLLDEVYQVLTERDPRGYYAANTFFRNLRLEHTVPTFPGDEPQRPLTISLEDVRCRVQVVDILNGLLARGLRRDHPIFQQIMNPPPPHVVE